MLFVAPLSGARLSHSLSSYKVFLFCHVLLTLGRFYSTIYDDFQWIVAVFISASMLVDIARQTQTSQQRRIDLDKAHKKANSVASMTVHNLLSTFSDASVVVDSEMKLIEPCSEMISLTGISAPAGKNFFEFVFPAERESL